MRCQHCGRTDSLVETTFRDEDGVLYTDWLDLCVYCEEIEIERSEARREWNAYRDEPCPEIELPQFPRPADDASPGHRVNKPDPTRRLTPQQEDGMSDLLARLVSLADCDGRAGEQLGKAMREAAAEIARLNKHIAILHDVADQRDQIILERNEQYRDAMEHAKIWRERAERAEALQNGEQTKRRAPEAKSHPDFDYCLSCGCAVMDHSLGFQEMPAGYHLMLDADGMYFFWMESETGRQSAIHWDKWAVYRGAKADAKRPR